MGTSAKSGDRICLIPRFCCASFPCTLEEINERFLLVRPDSRLELNIMCSTLHYCLKFVNILSDEAYSILYL